ncbi:MAG: hypothetical protein V4547_13620 [Bacteroidota bacterium]
MFENQISDFNKSILGLREFVDLIAPFLDAKQEEHSKPIESLVMSAMINEILSNKTEWKENEKKKFEEMKEKVDSDVLKYYDGKPDDITLIQDSSKEKKEKKEFKLSYKSNSKIDNHMQKAASTKMHVELLYKNSFIALISSAEWFFSEILHYYYDKFPESAGVQKKSLTLAELKSFGSVDDAEKYLIDTKIEDILRGSFDSWLSILKSELGLKLGYVDPIEDELVEIYQRRNTLVHNGGKVNSIYLSKVKEAQRKKIKLNDIINIDKAYLDGAIRKLQKTFILIASELWKKLDKDDKKRGDVLTDIIYENVQKSRWDICEGLCYFVINDSKLEPIDKLVAQINYWLCKKRTNQFESIKEEVNKANFSDKKEIFQLALYALKDDRKSFFQTLPIALDSKQLNIERLEEFPIFEELRETEEYKKFKATSKHFKQPNKKVDKLVTDKKTKAAANSTLPKAGRKSVKKGKSNK